MSTKGSTKNQRMRNIIAWTLLGVIGPMMSCSSDSWNESALQQDAAPTGTKQPWAPMTADFEMPEEISTFSKEHFRLFRDVDESRRVLYYIPTRGTLAIDGAGTSSPRPLFAASKVTLDEGPYAGKQSMLVGGVFNVAGYPRALQRLQEEAKDADYRIMPAFVVHGAQGHFSIVDRSLPAKPTSEELKHLKADDSHMVLIAATVTPFAATAPVGTLGFQAMVKPPFVKTVENKLKSGLSFADMFLATINWKTASASLTHKAVVNLDYSKLYSQFSSHFGVNYWFLSVDAKALIEKEVICEGIEKCAVSVEWYDRDGNRTEKPSSNYGMIEVVRSVMDELRKAMIAGAIKSQSALGVAEESSSESLFSLSVNWEEHKQQMKDRVEVYYNPDQLTEEVSTVYNIGCVKGAPDAVIKLDLKDEACAQLVQ